MMKRSKECPKYGDELLQKILEINKRYRAINARRSELLKELSQAVACKLEKEEKRNEYGKDT